jgi:hypothetical protein
MTDRATSVQVEQCRQILAAPGLFTEAERRRWMLDLDSMTRFEARWAVVALSETYKARKRQQEAA